MRAQAEYYGGATDRAQLPRGALPEVAFVGRSNVGKSSLINCLTNRKNLARTSRTPGRTRALQFFIVDQRLFLVDLPGYGFARAAESLRRSWQHMLREYLRDNPQLRLVIIVVDARHPLSALDLEMLDWLRRNKLHYVIVATKVDRVARTQLRRSEAGLRQQLGGDVVLFSSQTGQGRAELWRVIQDSLK